MINHDELKTGNWVLHKGGVRILPTQITLTHFEMLAKGQAKDFFPIPLKQEHLQKAGFEENKKYYQAPETREFILLLPVKGPLAVEIRAYLPTGQPVYARLSIGEQPASNHIFNLHQLQNLYNAVTAMHLPITL